MEHNTLVMQVAGRFTLETASQKLSMEQGEMLLVRKNQLGQITKTPSEGGIYQTIVLKLREDMLRQIALEEHIETEHKYTGPPGVLIPGDDFLHSFFQSMISYVRHPEAQVTQAVSALKIKEAVYLLLNIMPGLSSFLFDFSDPYKIDLEKFMLHNFHYNVPVEKFAQLTGRSLAGFKRDFQKIFATPPRQWLLEKRLAEARHLIEKKNKKKSAIYLDLGFESLSHFSHAFKKKFGQTPTQLAV